MNWDELCQAVVDSEEVLLLHMDILVKYFNSGITENFKIGYVQVVDKQLVLHLDKDLEHSEA